jgi:hypothetical protein
MKPMSQRKRILLAVVILCLLTGIVLGVDALGRLRTASRPEAPPPGSIPIYLDGRLAGNITAGDLEPIGKVSFVEVAQGVEQTGWLLRDVLLLRVARDKLRSESLIRVSSSSRNKAAEVTWAEADDPANHVMFDLSNRGTLKLVSTLEKLDTRDEWVQDADRIEVTTR